MAARERGFVATGDKVLFLGMSDPVHGSMRGDCEPLICITGRAEGGCNGQNEATEGERELVTGESAGVMGGAGTAAFQMHHGSSTALTSLVCCKPP